MTQPKFVICTDNKGYEVSLEVRKLYQVLHDPAADKVNQIRVIDESGESYLYPPQLFAPVKLPPSLAARVIHSG